MSSKIEIFAECCSYGDLTTFASSEKRNAEIQRCSHALGSELTLLPGGRRLLTSHSNQKPPECRLGQLGRRLSAQKPNQDGADGRCTLRRLPCQYRSRHDGFQPSSEQNQKSRLSHRLSEQDGYDRMTHSSDAIIIYEYVTTQCGEDS